MGYCYRNGIGVDRDEEKAAYWFLQCAKQDNPLAQNSLGYCYEDGIGVEKGSKQAVYWYTHSANHGMLGLNAIWHTVTAKGRVEQDHALPSSGIKPLQDKI